MIASRLDRFVGIGAVSTRRACLVAALALLAALLPVTQARAATTRLNDPQFHASGRGDTTTTGTIEAGSNRLVVASPASFKREQGIRVRRAAHSYIEHAEANWKTHPVDVTVIRLGRGAVGRSG
jgi:hypothetical protein